MYFQITILLDLKQKHHNCVYFLISQQGILLKSTSQAIRDNVKQQIDKFFTAKIQQLQTSQTSQFYQTILTDIQQQTQRLKDTRDCPYINLVYSDKLRNSCMAMKRFGYSKPYETWESYERQKKGFCYLIVRPEHRWKEIAGNVMSIVKKREGGRDKQEMGYKMEIGYEKFVWMYMNRIFEGVKKNLEVKEHASENMLVIWVKKQLTEYSDMQKQLAQIKFKYCTKKPIINTQQDTLNNPQQTNSIVLSSFQIQKLTQLIFHEFGLPKLVRQLRRKCSQFMIIGRDLQSLSFQQHPHAIQNRQDLLQISWKHIEHIFSLGKKNAIVNWCGSTYVSVRFDFPLRPNIQKLLALRMPCLPKYYAYYFKDTYVYFLRKYYPSKYKPYIESCRGDVVKQVGLMASLIQITRNLHARRVNVGSKFSDKIFVQEDRIVVQPSENGSNVEDVSKLTLMLREWVKDMKLGNSEKTQHIREQLERVSEPYEMLQILDNFIEEWI